MRMAIKTRTPRISVAQFRAASIVATLIFSGFLPCAVNKSLGYPRDFQNAVEHTGINRQAAAAIALPSPSEINMEAGQATFNNGAAPILYLSFPRDLTVVRPTSFEMPATARAIAPVERHANSRSVQSQMRSSRTIASDGLPRSLETNVDRIRFVTPSLAPMAFARFCVKYPRDCEIRRMAFRPRPMILGATQKADIVRVNREVNRAIVPQANNNSVMQEEWLVSPREGDCNDYAVTKRHELLARGWPSRSLLLAEVVIPSGEHHLILIVRTREDDLVLDNLNPSIRALSQVPYQWVRAQQEKNPKFWSTVNVTRAPRVAFNAR
jgi:predicted transglutaminase-like cysteine proteinase